MTERNGYCGIDVGTQGVRAVVVDSRGALLGSGSRALGGSHRDGDRHEQDPGAWTTALVGAVRDAVAALDADVHVAAVALDATSGTVLVERADGSAAGPALMYDDARAAAQASRVQDAGADLWRELGYTMQTSWALPKVLWLVEQGGLAASDRVVHQADHLVRGLVGHPVPADTSHALKTGADLRDATWPVEVLSALGIGPGRLPDLVLPGTVVGRVCAAAARATGLPEGAVVRAGMTDGCAGQIAAGAMRPGSWSSTLGTTLVIKGSVDSLVHDPTGAVYSHRHPDGGWLPGGASSCGAGIFTSAFPGADLDELTARAEQRPTTAASAYPLAGHGERFPFVAAGATGFVTGQPGGATGVDDADRFLALCQGLGYVERLAYDVLAGLGADVTGPVALTGGATRNPWLNQLRTDIIGRPTTLPDHAGAAFGMAVLAAAEPGDVAGTADRMVSVTQRLQPDRERGAALEAGYRRLVGELAERAWLDASVATAVLDASRGAA